MSQPIKIIHEEETLGVWSGRAKIGPIETNFSFKYPLPMEKQKLLTMALMQEHLKPKPKVCPTCGKPLA